MMFSTPFNSTGGWQLACPVCRRLLLQETSCYRCPACNATFKIQDRVLRFVGEDGFYEDKYAPQPWRFSPNEHSPWGKLSLYLVSMHYLWYIRKYVNTGSWILDVACNAGMSYLTTRGRVAGLEISFAAAREMARVYELSLQADALKVPLADCSVDAVVSRFFLEHVQMRDKLSLLKELRRVIRPGGWLVTLQDCECNNSLWRWAKQDVDLFQRRFIENDGHYGLVYASENLTLFQEAGFSVVKHYAYNKTPLVSLSMLQWMQPYRTKSNLANVLLSLAQVVSNNRMLNALYTCGLTLFDDLVERALPLDNARYLLCVCRRS